MSEVAKIYDLWEKDMSEDFTDQERSFLKRYLKKQRYLVKYGFYTKVSLKGKQIAVIFDLEPYKNRKSGSENNWEVICQRQMTDVEIDEYITFYFRPSFKRFLVFYYKDLERLLLDDSKLAVETPYEFIKACEKRGYVGKYQTKIEFEFN